VKFRGCPPGRREAVFAQVRLLNLGPSPERPRSNGTSSFPVRMSRIP
jgi:hypothetical protein